MMQDRIQLILGNRKRLIIGSFLLIFVALIVVFFLRNVVLFTSINNVPEGESIKLAVIENGKTKEIAGSNIAIVPRGSETIIVSVGDSVKTLSSLAAPWYGFVVKAIDLQPSKNADKVAFASLSGVCTTYNSTLDKLLRYDCASPDMLYDYKTPDNNIWGDRGVKELSYIENQTLPPFMNGVIGIAEAESHEEEEEGDEEHIHNETPVEIKVTNPDSTKSYRPPTGLTGEGLSGLRIYTDTTSTTNSHFVLVDGFGVVYLASLNEQDDEVTYKITDTPDTYSYRYNTTACSVSGEKVICYRGRNSTTPPGDATLLTQPKIEEYSFTDGLLSSKNVELVSNLDTLNITNGNLYGVGNKTLYSFSLENDKYIAKPVAKDITSATSDGEDILFAYENAAYIYKAKTHSSYQLFQSSNVNVIGIYPVDDQVFVFGTTKHGDTAIYAYKLTGDRRGEDQRLIDILPLAYYKIDGLFANDFVGNKIFLQPRNDAISTDDDIKNNFINTVSSLGVDLNSENVSIRR